MSIPGLPVNRSSPEMLEQISTIWSNVLKAQGGQDHAHLEQLRFFDRYHRAILRYLEGCVHNSELAADLFQEFALRFVRRDFMAARPSQGSFRQFVKTALINLVRNHQRLRPMVSLQEHPSLEAVSLEENGNEFDSGIRDELLNRAWQSLRNAELPGKPPFYSALRLRADNPDWSNTELAVNLARQLNESSVPPDSAFRKFLQRAREAFADQLLSHCREFLGTPSRSDLQAELADLGLLVYCSGALDRAWQETPDERSRPRRDSD